MSEEQVTPAAAAQPPQATFEDFMALCNQRPKEPFTLPSGQQCWVWGLTPVEKKAWYDSCDKELLPDGSKRITDVLGDAKLIVRSVRTADGRFLFTEQHLLKINEWPPIVLAPLVALCAKVSAIGGEADAQILKNFARTLTSGSSSA